MEINKKSGIYRLDGEFVQNNISSPENSFYGYIEPEKDMYMYNDSKIGDVKLVFFKGIVVNNYDVNKKSSLVLGGFQETCDNLNMYFRKLDNDENLVPVVYEVNSKNGELEGSYVGEWSLITSSMLLDIEQAKVNNLKELSEEEVASLKVKDFLKKGYAETKNLPPQMKVIVLQEERTNKIIKENSKLILNSQFGA